MKTLRHFCLIVSVLCLTSCAATVSREFATPGANWNTRSGQLAYHGPKMSLIGEVVVRTSPGGDMELTFSKAPAFTLMTIKQNANFARASGPLAHGSWSGAPASAPQRLRGWFALREKILAGSSHIQFTSGAESFNLRF